MKKFLPVLFITLALLCLVPSKSFANTQICTFNSVTPAKATAGSTFVPVTFSVTFNSGITSQPTLWFISPENSGLNPTALSATSNFPSTWRAGYPNVANFATNSNISENQIAGNTYTFTANWNASNQNPGDYFMPIVYNNINTDQCRDFNNIPIFEPGPMISSIPNTTITTAQTYSESGSFTDSDSKATSWTATVNYGDGSGNQSLPLTGQNFSLSHTFSTTGVYSIIIKVTNNDGVVGAATSTVTVNSAPTPTPTPVPTYNLTGIVYNDVDENGSQNPGEQGIAGATVSLNTGQSTTTDSNGNYTFSNLESGTYTETLTLPDGYMATTTNPVSVPLAANTTVNFGIAQANSLVTAINAGGDTQGNYVADTDYSRGTTYTSSASVDTTNITNPASQSVYQTVRYGNSFSYTIPNLTANGTYTVRLHFNEIYWTAAGQRVFNVAINGDQVLSNFDIYQAAGGTNKAIVEQFPATADANGNVTIQFTGVTDNAMVNGIELYNGTLPQPSPTPTPTPVTSAYINAGGATAEDYQADNGYTGGTTYSTNASIDISGVTIPAPESVYQTVRYGNSFSYTIPTNSPNTNYTVRLDFSEPYFNSAGSREFNVSLNGTQDLSNFDVYQEAGGQNKAVSEQFTTTSDSNGLIHIQFNSVVDNAMVSGIEVSQQ